MSSITSSIKKPRTWLCGAAFAAAFWITLRVVSAAPPPPPPRFVEGADPAGEMGIAGGSAGGAVTTGDEVRDPALETMITRLAAGTPRPSAYGVR